MNKILTGLAAVLLVALGGWWLLGNSQTSTGPSLSPISTAEAQDVDTSQVLEMSLGDPDAPITIVEYASFTCPHCANFHAGPLQQLKTDYIDTGKVHFIYREVYFDRYGLWAGMVARCAGPLRYFAVSDMIYDQQREWTASGDPAGIAEALRKIGKVAGLDDAALDACFADAEKAQAMVALYQENAARDDIRSTPSFLIDGQKYSNMSYADFAKILDEKLAN